VTIVCSGQQEGEENSAKLEKHMSLKQIGGKRQVERGSLSVFGKKNIQL
jgi:hypothetical protein